jgi:hypothetical protein
MFWLSISTLSPELEAIAPQARPWAIIKKIWQFSRTYGEYQSLPPSQRRNFILEQENRRDRADGCSEPCL